MAAAGNIPTACAVVGWEGARSIPPAASAGRARDRAARRETSVKSRARARAASGGRRPTLLRSVGGPVPTRSGPARIEVPGRMDQATDRPAQWPIDPDGLATVASAPSARRRNSPPRTRSPPPRWLSSCLQERFQDCWRSESNGMSGVVCESNSVFPAVTPPGWTHYISGGDACKWVPVLVAGHPPGGVPPAGNPSKKPGRATRDGPPGKRIRKDGVPFQTVAGVPRRRPFRSR